jgi:peptide/nickel transport system permease protein
MSGGFNWRELVLPVAVLVLYDFGYVARMTRASMADVMTQPYIRTALLKGLPFRAVVVRHALRNALIAPFTVILLQVNWLLSGVIVVESFFAYKGFGALLLEASLFGDIFLIEACAMVAVVVAVGTQTLADIAYAYLSPRIRFV